MAVNPLYRNEFYFFSGMYDDTLITDFYRKICAETYTKSIEYQHNMIGRKRNYQNINEIFYCKTFSDFSIDEKYNRTVGIPSGSRIITFDKLILPIYNKKKFISTYGTNFQIIPITDFYKRNDIFDKSIYLQLGKYRLLSAYLIQNTDKTVTLAIPNSNSIGVSRTAMDKMIAESSSDEKIWIFTDEITQLYYTDGSLSANVGNTSINGNYEVKLSVNNAYNTIGDRKNHEYTNSWDCLMSVNTNKFGKKILVTTPCTLKSVYRNDIIFNVNEKFINMIKSNGVNFNLIFIQRPNRKHILQYNYSKTSVPIIPMDYIYNPSGNINIEVFEIEKSNMCKGRKLYSPDFKQIYFPNIFDFSELNINNSDLLIEISEYDSGYTNQKMNNSISPLIDSLTPEFYTNYVVNEYDKNSENYSLDLKHYHPSDFGITLNDYIHSEYYGNIRGYILDKLEKTFKTDPYLLAAYYRWMQTINSNILSLSGTPKKIRFGTNKKGEFSGINKVVTNTSVASMSSDDIQYFSEPHSYITYYNSMRKCPSMIYINGKYIRPTCTRFYNGLNYAFLPISKVNNEMEKFKSDDEIISASPITIDMYPDAYTSISEVPKDAFTINSMDDVIKIFDDENAEKMSLEEIVLYDNSTGKYLGYLTDLFNVSFIASEFLIKNPGITDKIMIAKGETIQYLLTSLREVYTTMDEEGIILGSINIPLSWNDFVDSLIKDGIISDDQKIDFMRKKLDFKNIEITPKNESLIGMTISAYSRNFKYEYILYTDDGSYNSDKNYTEYIIDNLDIDPKLSRYFIFINGQLQINRTANSAYELTEVTHTFGGQMILRLNGDRTNSHDIITIVHMPVSQTLLEVNKNTAVRYMKNAEIPNNMIDTLWPINNNDGIIMYGDSTEICYTYPLEDSTNIKFTIDGFRLPPISKSTNSIYAFYYDSDRCKYSINNNDVNTNIAVFTIDNDRPFTDIAKYNAFNADIRNDEESRKLVNKLDLLLSR